MVDMKKIREASESELAMALFGVSIERAACDEMDDFSPEPGEEFLTSEELDTCIATIESELRRRAGKPSN